MRYATSPTTASHQARSLRIGRCARCHASVLSADEHYGDGAGLVHAACVAAPQNPDRELRPAVAQTPRRTRRLPTAPGRPAQVATAIR